MFSTFATALSALNAQSAAINITGNNLANLNTVGYKASQVQFHDLMAQTLGAGSATAQVGMGVGPTSSLRSFVQGTIQATTSPTAAAIQGNGFFVVKDAANQTLYTRNGQFQLDKNGLLVTATGEKVQGWTPSGGTVSANGPLGDITAPLGAVIPARSTTSMSISLNLNAKSAADDTSKFSAPLQVVDSQGGLHTLTVTFTKTDVNKWSYSVAAPAEDLKGGSTAEVATGTLEFNGDGSLKTPASKDAPPSIKLTGLADGADDMAIAWNLFDSSGAATISQFAQTSGVSNTTQDGATTGQIMSIGIANDGLVIAEYSNGDHSTIGQLALASFRNPESLLAVGNNNLQPSASSAPPAIGASNTNGRGQIIGGALESSTSDMATEFTNLLTFERGYQAASRIISTSDQLLQETVNLIRA